MGEYGLTPNGVNIKRFDVILDEMQTHLSERWGVNVKQNPKSFLNVHLTNIADKMAELWEFGQDVYNSQYPLTAEGMYLDGVAQFSGTYREQDAPSYYYILCTGLDGTVIPSDTIISTSTNPVTLLRPTQANTISRENFNKALVRIASVDGNEYTVGINGQQYSYVPAGSDTTATILQGLAAAISDPNFEISVESDALSIASKETSDNSQMYLSGNLTTVTVGSVFSFATEEYGDVYLPPGTVTVITRAVTGLQSVANVGGYISGQSRQTDSEYRKSYNDKIFSHSSGMLASIKSAILTNCQGVESVAAYENDTNETDAMGRPPHSIEIVCDGGDATEIAEQIFKYKSGGISTFGTVATTLQGEEEEDVVIRFNRPAYLYAWVYVMVTVAQGATLPSGYEEKIKTIILDAVNGLQCGDDLIPQKAFMDAIYKNVSGISYLDVSLAATLSPDVKPPTYDSRNIYADLRDKVVMDPALQDNTEQNRQAIRVLLTSVEPDQDIILDPEEGGDG